MGINSPSDVIADLEIAPTDQGMVRLYVSGKGFEIPMDFTGDEARDIADEIITAAKIADAKSFDK